MHETRTDHLGKGQTIAISYSETDGLLWLSIKNFLLSVITLTIYRFWGKTNVRRHIWSNININGEALEYTGTGKELFLGALIVFGVLGIPVIALLGWIEFTYGSESAAAFAANMLIALAIALLYGMAVYRARRYRLSRTLWRGIRGTLNGSPTSFSLLYFAAMLLRFITLGWSGPAMNLNIQKRMIGDMEFGQSSFMFEGWARPLYRRFALCWFLTPAVILGILGLVAISLGIESGHMQEFFQDISDVPESNNKFAALAGVFIAIFAVIAAYSVLWTFYTALEMNLFAGYTSFANARFKLDATPSSLIGLALGNLAIMIFTLSIGQPFVQQRLIRYLCNRLSVDGTVNVDAIQQSSATLDRRGEGLVEAFDIDAF